MVAQHSEASCGEIGRAPIAAFDEIAGFCEIARNGLSQWPVASSCQYRDHSMSGPFSDAAKKMPDGSPASLPDSWRLRPPRWIVAISELSSSQALLSGRVGLQ